MALYVLSNLFLKIYFEIYSEFYLKYYKINVEEIKHNIDYNKLEEVLNQYLIKTMAFKMNYIDNMKEVEISFQNIVKNGFRYNCNLISLIENYGDDYIKLLDSHPLTSMFIDAANRVYSDNFDIKHSMKNMRYLGINIGVKNINKRFNIVRVGRQDEEMMPTLIINNIDDFESILASYIETIKSSNSFYNIFDRKFFNERNDIENIKMIFEGIMLNISYMDGLNMEDYFRNYINYVKNEEFNNITSPKFVGNLFNDELYLMSKRSELWYETPYYLSFMLKNKRIELPNIRMGVSHNNGEKVANIIAVQTSQSMKESENFKELQEEMKIMIPSDSYFRFINPSHLISLVMTFGYLKGLGIDKVVFKDYLPFRYKKVIFDKQLSEEEAHRYQTRLTNKTLSTFLRIVSNMNGIDIESMPDVDTELQIKIGDIVVGKNDFLTNLYNLGLEFGKKNKLDEKVFNKLLKN